MTLLDESPFLWLEFDERGALVEPDAFEKLQAKVAETGATDLVVISHGWKNDRAAALRIYKPLWENTRAALKQLDPAKIVVAGILWPSTPYGHNFDEAALLAAASQGALSSDGGAAAEDIDARTLQDAITDFLDDEDDDAFREQASEVAEDLSGDAAVAFVQAALAQVVTHELDQELASDLDPLRTLAEEDPKSMLLSLASVPVMPIQAEVGGALGIGDDIGKFFQGSKAAVARLLGQLSFYKMKGRAGVVGGKLGGLLATRTNADAVRLHLVGHSFGARLVTSAANTLVLGGKEVDTLTMLQGAFSHNALAASFEGKPGAFAAVANGGVRLVAITHTHNDRACTVAYAAASRLSRDTAKDIGDASDKFGAMGANGAQNISVVKHSGTPGGAEARPVAGKINNYLADAYIVGNPPGHDAHGDVFNPTVGKLLASVLEA